MSFCRIDVCQAFLKTAQQSHPRAASHNNGDEGSLRHERQQIARFSDFTGNSTRVSASRANEQIGQALASCVGKTLVCDYWRRKRRCRRT